jgi:hypothetical protein
MLPDGRPGFVASRDHEAVVCGYRQLATSSHTTDQGIATPMAGLKVQPP